VSEKPNRVRLSGRERQIIDVLYRAGRATAAEVLEGIPDPPGYSAVRALLRVLETKGHVRHTRDGARYVYFASQPRQVAAKSAIAQVVENFFGGSVERAVAALLTESDRRLSDEELSRLAGLVEAARERES
jgi:predicted transcriptional regulator